ncbi:MAG: metal-dependent transcriptional regulator [Desulforegulaceae bacterium]|nr:metal-dependent transcriptional regulator [Desulforegulaceae bacterium]
MKNQYPSLTATLEDYLAAIFRLAGPNGEARSNAIADELNVTRSTVTTALRSLSARGLIIYKPYCPISLTSQGRELGKRIAHRNFILNEFFGKILHLSEPEAKETACRVEHAVSDDAVLQLGRFLLFLKDSGLDLENWPTNYKFPKTHAIYPTPDLSNDQDSS